MIRLVVHLPNRQVKSVDWVRPMLTIGRAHTNDVVFPADNVSGQHAQIVLQGGRYLYRDQNSTNGSVVIRRGQHFPLKGQTREMALEPGDRIFLASMDHEIIVEAIHEVAADDDEDSYENTIIAEESSRPAADLEVSLGDDSDALRAAVRLARELTGLEAVHEIAELTCRSCLKAFLKARRVAFLVPREDGFHVECVISGEAAPPENSSSLLRSRQLLDRCLAERKGYLFLIEQNKMRAVATMISAAESLDGSGMTDRVILCCPLFQNERCYGFIEIEAPLGSDRQSLTRRDLSLVTLMGHLVAARLMDMENQRARLKLARKATAGYLAATVGHCFKNLLFVPMSLGKLLPMSLAKGNMEEVNWMLARNNVNIRYLDILSNEFAAASKDPTQGFEECSIDRLLEEIANLVNQISPERVAAELALPVNLPRVNCHGGALRRLLMNLALNAVDAFFGAAMTEKGRIELKAAYDEDADELCITVRDNGPGMPEGILGNLREIFRQVQSSADALGELQNIAERVRSTKDQGFKEHYGLGFLFVCQTVTAHQGRLEIASEPGKGTRFDIMLPRRSALTNPGTVAVEDGSAVKVEE